MAVDAQSFDLEHRRTHLAEHRRRESRWSYARLLLFLAAAAGWIPLRDQPAAAGAVTTVGLLLFAGAVARHGRYRRARVLSQNMLLVATEAQTRQGGQLAVVRSGTRPADADSPEVEVAPVVERGTTETLSPQEIDDLDLYAVPASVFGLLNRTSTAAGRRRLRDWLEHPALEARGVLHVRAATEAIVANPEARLTILAAAAGLRPFEADLDKAAQAAHVARPLRRPRLLNALRIWSMPSAVVYGFCLIVTARGEYEAVYLALMWLAFNGVLFTQVRREVRAALAPWLHLRYALAELGETLAHGAHALSTLSRGGSAEDHVALREIRTAIDRVTAPPLIGQLARRLAWADVGGFLHAVFNFALFYDVHVAQAVMKIVLPHRDPIRRGISALADLEALTSLACFVAEQPVACPVEIAEQTGIAIEHGVHPLVDPREAVPNDLSLDGHIRTWLITGSNMAGKSTFLRMAGVNVLLAQVSGYAAAARMTLCPVRLLTDLRIRDDLGRHESYFLAEVRQLRRMVLPPDDGVPVLGLIDEPFRGTNSQERLAAGEAVLSHLLRSPHFFLIATHEQQLTNLADSHPARNFHFHEDLTERGPVFDYRLQPGPAHVRNALRVLAREGYPAAVVETAQALLRPPASSRPAGAASISTPPGDGV